MAVLKRGGAGFILRIAARGCPLVVIHANNPIEPTSGEVPHILGSFTFILIPMIEIITSQVIKMIDLTTNHSKYYGSKDRK